VTIWYAAPLVCGTKVSPMSPWMVSRKPLILPPSILVNLPIIIVGLLALRGRHNGASMRPVTARSFGQRKGEELKKACRGIIGGDPLCGEAAVYAAKATSFFGSEGFSPCPEALKWDVGFAQSRHLVDVAILQPETE
jgi:hypothetical protein